MSNIMDLGNTRSPEQRAIMEKQLAADICHLCREGFEERHTPGITHEEELWFIAPVTWPYDKATHHYLIVPKRHITFSTELTDKEKLNLFEMVGWLEKKFGLRGYSFFSRNGDTTYTGGTLVHLHYHLLSDGQKPHDCKYPDDHILVTLAYKKKK